jgi:hypothetical protein
MGTLFFSRSNWAFWSFCSLAGPISLTLARVSGMLVLTNLPAILAWAWAYLRSTLPV